MKLIRLLSLACAVALAAACSSHNTVKVVSQDGKGDYTTIQEALNDVPDDLTEGKWIIRIHPGEYNEKLFLPEGKDNVMLIGEDPSNTVIWFEDWSSSGTRGQKATVVIAADDFTAANITFRNPHQNIREIPGENKRSQATAIQLTGDRLAFYNCRFEGNQDTFYGRGTGRVYVKGSYVEGNVDYIYGSSVMVFDDCEIFSNQHESYITAGSSLLSSKFGITFLDCRLTAKEAGQPDHDGVPFQYFYLGRPWHNSAHVAFLRCHEPATLNPDGWTFMNSNAYPTFYEYKCTGPGATTERLLRRKLGRQLTDAEAAAYTVANIFSADTNPTYTQDWLPARSIGQVLRK